MTCRMSKRRVIKTSVGMASFFALFFLLFDPGHLAAQGNEIRVLESGLTTMVLEAITLHYQVEALDGAGEGYSRLKASSCGYTSSRGRPLLPVRGFLVGMPLESELQVHVLEEEWTTLDVGLLCPVPTPSADQQASGRSVSWTFTPAEKVYGRNAFYPSIMAEAEPLGFFRDQRIGQIRLFPFQYNPVSGQLRVCHRLVVMVHFIQRAVSTPSAARLSQDTPVAEQVLSDLLLNYPTARSWRQARTMETLPQIMGHTEGSQRCRITVVEDGLYSISRQELTQAGLDLGIIDPRTFQLSNKGKTVPLYVIGEKDGSFDEGDAIEFYGRSNTQTYLPEHEDMVQDPYSLKNVYHLSWGSEEGTRMVEEDGGIKDIGNPAPRRPICYEFTVHAEEDNHRDHLNEQFSLRDHWFWDSGVSAQQMSEYPINLPRPDRDSPLRPRVRVMLHGRTSSEQHDPDHHTLIYLNDQLVADRMWDGQEKLLIDSAQDGFEVTSSAIRKGDNILSLICPGDTEAGLIDRVLLNWIQVEYPRLYWAEDDFLEFNKPKGGPTGLYQFTLKGFRSSPVWVYKLGTSVMVNGQGEWTEIGGKSYYQLTFQDEIFDQQAKYLAVSSRAKKRVESIELRSPSDLRAPGKGADLVIIVHQDFYEHVLPLADFRASQGLQVEVVEVGHIYDEFSHGLFTPEAIRDFLKYAHQNWDPQPLYVLLVGDGSWDYKDTMGLGGNYIPPIMAQTSLWGATPCDNLYACVSGEDQLPDLFLGRLPVRTNSQLDGIINKIIGGEDEPELGDWRRRLLFICGTGNYGSTFRFQSERLIQNYVTPEFMLSRIYAFSPYPETDPFYGRTQDLIDALDAGASLVNYIGHGGGGIWSDAGLMRLDDVERLRNASRWPMVLSMTCFTTAFEEPIRDCLGERLLLAEDKGVVGFWGASGLGWLYGDYQLDSELMKIIFSRGYEIIGQAVIQAKLQYISHYGGQVARDLVNTYTLLGDPAARIGFPERKVSLSIQPRAVNLGDTLNIQGTTGGRNGGQAQLTILDHAGVPLWESSLPVVDGGFQAQIGLPDTASRGTGIARCYFWDSQNLTDGAGAVSFSLGEAYFDSILTDPAEPTEGDSVHIWATVDAPQGVDSILCRWTKSPIDTTQMMVLQSSPHQYRTSEAIPPFSAGALVRYWVIVVDSSGQRKSSAQHFYQLPSPPDLQILQNSIILTGEETVGIALDVENLGGMQANSILVRVTITESFEKSDTREGLIEHIPGGARATLFLPWALSSHTYAVLVEVDPEDAIQETNENNNVASAQIDVDRFNVTPGEGTVVNGYHAPAYSPDGNFNCDIPAGVVQSPQVVSIQSMPPHIEEQPDLQPAKLRTGVQLAYQVALVDSSISVSDSPQILLAFRLDGGDSLNISHRDKLAIYRWNLAIQRWIRHAEVSWPASDSVVATVSKLGLFCPMINGDQTPPSIEVNAEDQHFAEGALVASNAKIVAIIQDANGIDVIERPIEVRHNGQDVEAHQIVVSASPERNSVPVSYAMNLPTGKHSVTFAAHDCNGNQATKTVTFQVIGSHGIDHLGNYPNPFEKETVFTYRLTGPNHAEEIFLKIYTVSGRLVRSFHNFLDQEGQLGTALDYHLKTWDGRDEQGEPLANGVYFYKIRAKWEDQVVSKTGKLAILK